MYIHVHVHVLYNKTGVKTVKYKKVGKTQRLGAALENNYFTTKSKTLTCLIYCVSRLTVQSRP